MLATAVDWLFARGHVAELVLAVMIIEGVLLVAGRGWAAGAAALRLLPGALMMLALRAALTGADWRWIAVMLALSYPAHLADLARGPGRGRP